MRIFLQKLTMVLLVLQALPCAAVTREEIIAKLAESKTLGSDQKINAAIDTAHKSATVTLFAKPEALEKDFKIDAVLIAKEVMSLDKENIVKVRVLFYDKSNLKNYHQVTVRAGDIMAFSGGSLTNQALLDSLDVEQPSPSSSPTPVVARSQSSTTFDQARLEKAQAAINALRSKKVGVTAYQGLYDETAALAQDESKAPQAMEKLAQLESSLEEQQSKLETKSIVTSAASPRVQSAVEGLRDANSKTLAALPDVLANPESAMQSFRGLREQFEQFRNMAHDYFGHWQIGGEVCRRERAWLYYHYVDMEKKHYNMDSCWYQYQTIERMCSQFEKVEGLHDQAVTKHDMREASMRTQQLELMRSQIEAKIRSAAQAAGLHMPSGEHEHGEHHR